jgi:hypothetical protein
MTSFDEDEDPDARFERETAYVVDPDAGEVIPPGATEPDAEDFSMPLSAFITEELAAAIFSVPANMMARSTGREWWRLEKDEEDLLGKGTAPCLRFLAERYLGSNVGPFAGIGAALAVIYAPRILHEAREREKEKKEKENPFYQKDQPPQPIRVPPSAPQPHQTQRSSSSSAGVAAASQPSSSSDFEIPYKDEE